MTHGMARSVCCRSVTGAPHSARIGITLLPDLMPGAQHESTLEAQRLHGFRDEMAQVSREVGECKPLLDGQPRHLDAAAAQGADTPQLSAQPEPFLFNETTQRTPRKVWGCEAEGGFHPSTFGST